MKLQCINPQTMYFLRDSKGSVYQSYSVKARQSAFKEICRPCGNCRPCRKEKARQWTIRLLLEQMSHEESCFVTLTFEDAPKSLDKRTCQLFIKRLRKKLKKPIRYYLVGEYGDVSRRAHYHAIIFGHSFRVGSEPLGKDLYTHGDLVSAWGHGHVAIGTCTHASILYCANYVQKKFNGHLADQVYQVDGEIVSPPFALMSKKPAIGRDFFEKYKDQLLRDQTVVISGKEVRIPKYFLRIFKEDDKIEFDTAPVDYDESARLLDISRRSNRLEILKDRHSAKKL